MKTDARAEAPDEAKGRESERCAGCDPVVGEAHRGEAEMKSEHKPGWRPAKVACHVRCRRPRIAQESLNDTLGYLDPNRQSSRRTSQSTARQGKIIH
jgi:hypothetical protein